MFSVVVVAAVVMVVFVSCCCSYMHACVCVCFAFTGRTRSTSRLMPSKGRRLETLALYFVVLFLSCKEKPESWWISFRLRPRFCLFVAVAETVLCWCELEAEVPDDEVGVAGWVKVSLWLSLFLILGGFSVQVGLVACLTAGCSVLAARAFAVRVISRVGRSRSGWTEVEDEAGVKEEVS